MPALCSNSVLPKINCQNFHLAAPQTNPKHDRPLRRDINTLATVLRYLSQASSKTAGARSRTVCRTISGWVFSLWKQFIRAWNATTSNSGREEREKEKEIAVFKLAVHKQERQSLASPTLEDFLEVWSRYNRRFIQSWPQLERSRWSWLERVVLWQLQSEPVICSECGWH